MLLRRMRLIAVALRIQVVLARVVLLVLPLLRAALLAPVVAVTVALLFALLLRVALLGSVGMITEVLRVALVRMRVVLLAPVVMAHWHCWMHWCYCAWRPCCCSPVKNSQSCCSQSLSGRRRRCTDKSGSIR